MTAIEFTRLAELMTPENKGVYWDPSINQRISTHSMLKTFRKCPMCAYFKYMLRLKPKMLGKPLKRGTWFHELLEAHGNGEDWRPIHARHSTKFDELFDEEKDYYGDMPTEIETIFKSYLWHYKKDPWNYIANEFSMECDFPDGTRYRCKVDSLIENEHGLWLVDNKTHARIPDMSFRLRDSQSALYLWCARENGLPVQGFIWNYVKWKVPTVPKLLVKGDRISDSAIDTDYPTFVTALKKYKEDNPKVFRIRPQDRAKAQYLRGLQYEFGKPQISETFRRDILEKSDDMLDRVMRMNYYTSLRLHNYDFSDPEYIEMADPQYQGFFEDYTDLHVAHTMGTNLAPLIKQNYTVGDPNDYYQDRAGDFERGK